MCDNENLRKHTIPSEMWHVLVLRFANPTSFFYINNLSRDPTFLIKKTHVWIFIHLKCIDNGEFHTGEISKSTIGR